MTHPSLALPFGASFVPFTPGGRLTLATGEPNYEPQNATAASTDTAAETLTFSSAHGWVTGTICTIASTIGGLTNGTQYFINTVSATTVSFHTTLANAEADASRVDLTSNVTAEIRPMGVSSTTLRYTPDQHRWAPVYTGTHWKMIEFEELELPLSITSGSNYDVFLVPDGTASRLELSTAWSGASTRSQALTHQDGIHVKDGSPTRLWLGTLRGNATNTCITFSNTQGIANTTGQWFLWNNYNRVPRALVRSMGSSSHTYTSATVRQYNADASAEIEFVTGSQHNLIAGASGQMFISSGTPGNVTIGLGDNTTTSNSPATTDLTSAVSINRVGGTFTFAMPMGYRFMSINQKTSGAAVTGTFDFARVFALLMA